MVEDKISKKEIVYGINTGIGEFSETVLDDSQLEEFQKFLIYKKHTDIDAEAKRKYYEKSPILSFFLMVYLFPINSLNFVYRLRGMYFYEKCKTEIEVLKKELEQTTRKRNL